MEAAQSTTTAPIGKRPFYRRWRKATLAFIPWTVLVLYWFGSIGSRTSECVDQANQTPSYVQGALASACQASERPGRSGRAHDRPPSATWSWQRSG